MNRALVALVVVAALMAACQSTRRAPTLGVDELEAAAGELRRPLPGDLAALYRLRVPSSGGLRLAVLTVAGAGRLTVSEPFGSALSVTAWTADDIPVLYDLREGCRLEADDLAGVIGVGRLPLPEAVRLLGGRLPAVAADRVEAVEDGRLQVGGEGWACKVSVAPDPWRVMMVEEVTAGDRTGWRLRLDDHTSSVPGFVRVDRSDGRWAELQLVRLQWNQAAELPPLPDLPECNRIEAGPTTAR